ncbi:MAG TPA: OmpA family protein [Terriglobales bacterium]|nr:OmpA family protein [Terriglobales bacterium]
MKRIVIALCAVSGMLISTGCATKNYVRKEMTPIVDKVNELDDLTAKNTQQIRDVDSRAQQGLAGVNAKSAEADQKAQAAGTRAGEAQTIASGAVTRAQKLSDVVANLDNYQPVAEASVHFGFDKDALTKKSREALDQFAAEVPNAKGYIVELTGGTDSVGDKQYNYQLSERRAAAVVQYLLANHNIPAHKIYVIGLGEDKEVAPNQSAKGRAENRRVEVRLLANMLNNNQPAPATTSSAVQPR